MKLQEQWVRLRIFGSKNKTGEDVSLCFAPDTNVSGHGVLIASRSFDQLLKLCPEHCPAWSPVWPNLPAERKDLLGQTL